MNNINNINTNHILIRKITLLIKLINNQQERNPKCLCYTGSNWYNKEKWVATIYLSWYELV